MSRTKCDRAEQKRAHRERRRDAVIAAHPRRMGHETMRTLDQAWWEQTARLIGAYTPPPGAGPALLDWAALNLTPDFCEMAKAYQRRATIEKRFWVRGHWRRPNASWEDQRLRWIKPYLKGPEMTAIVERAYAMKAAAA